MTNHVLTPVDLDVPTVLRRPGDLAALAAAEILSQPSARRRAMQPYVIAEYLRALARRVAERAPLLPDTERDAQLRDSAGLHGFAARVEDLTP